MSKIKLFLLGGILSILLICSFTSAQSIITSCSSYSRACTVSDYTYQLYSNLYSCFSIGDNVEKLVITPNCNNSFNYNNGLVDYYDIYYCNSGPLTITNQSAFCISANNGSYTLDFVLKPLVSGGIGNFTPVITGVKDTTFQLIPLIVYIGIGVLLVIIGFFAIRWLVNWIVGKINSNFNSKRN